MQQDINTDCLKKTIFLLGSYKLIEDISNSASKKPFDERIIEFLNEVSSELINSKSAKKYPDVVTFGFWIRKGSLLNLKKRFEKQDGLLHLGRGVSFHIAPSNVPVNFAYSLVMGLVTGNSNIVRIPSKDFPQVGIIVDAFSKVLDRYEELRSYIVLVRYDRDKDLNDLFSSISDVRIIWGGDQTISEIRKSILPPRSGEITFADRYSIAVIDSDVYMDIENKDAVAKDFYNDTFLSDQNACTSPRIVIWMGNHIEEAKKIFWDKEYEIVEERYTLHSIQSVNKLSKSYLVAANEQEIRVEKHVDNLIIRIKVTKANAKLMDYRENSGFFYEYDCDDINDIRDLCNDRHCQTLAYIGDKQRIIDLVGTGIKGVDRIVPIGHTMDFDLIWDGYDLPAVLTRTVSF